MDWVQLVSNYGFPIVVSLYLLVKTQQKLEEVSNLLARISESLQHANHHTPHSHQVATPVKRRTNQLP
ncbi:MAG: YvrJ family protein [Tumebacillaceae bacterium]